MKYRILLVMIWLVTSNGFVPVLHSSTSPCIDKTRCPNLVMPANLSVISFPGGPLQVNVYDDGSLGLQQNGINQFFAERASGVFLWAGGSAWGPTVPAGNALPAFTLVNQGALAGSGTASDPYVVTTVFSVGSTGLVLTQNVKYVIGGPNLSFNWTLQNNGPMQGVSLFHAADLYVDGNDSGGGFFDINTQTVGGQNIQSQAYGLFTPITPADAYEEAGYSTIWSRISSYGTANSGFLDRIVPDYIDNGAGLQWNMPGLASGASIQISDQFSLTSIPSSGGGGAQQPPLNVEHLPGLHEFEFGTQVAESPNAYSSNDISIDLPITRYYGNPSKIAHYAYLTLDAFDVDSPSEGDSVQVGNCTVGSLAGRHNSWQQVTFRFLSSCLNFPSPPINYTDDSYDHQAISAHLVPSSNQITIRVDTQRHGYKTMVAWAKLYVGGVRPVLFSHGLDKDCQDREYRGLGRWKEFLRTDGIPALGNRNDGSKYIDTQEDSMATTYQEMRNLFGLRTKNEAGVLDTDKIILVGHSMGGLIGREFTDIFGSNTVANFITFGTPNGGDLLSYTPFQPGCSQEARDDLQPTYVKDTFNPVFDLTDTWQPSTSSHMSSIAARLHSDAWSDGVVSNDSTSSLAYDHDVLYTFDHDKYSYESAPWIVILHTFMETLQSMYDLAKREGHIGQIIDNPSSTSTSGVGTIQSHQSDKTPLPSTRPHMSTTLEQGHDLAPIQSSGITLVPGSSKTVMFPVDTATHLTPLIDVSSTITSTQGLTYTLKTPSGSVYEPTTGDLEIDNPEVGNWTAVFTTSVGLTQTTSLGFVPAVTSALTVIGTANPFYILTGGTGSFQVALQDGSAPLTGANVSGILTTPIGITTTVNLGEVSGSPGIYALSYPASLSGNYRLDAQIAGTRLDGTLFRRETSLDATSMPGGMIAPNGSDVVWNIHDLNQDGLTDILSATLQIQAPQSGTYMLDGSIGTVAQPAQFRSRQPVALMAGINTVTLPFDGKAIGQLPNADTYFLQNIRLLQSDNQVIDERDQFNNSISIDPSSFQHDLLVGVVISGSPLDTNNSGHFNQLLFTAALTATRSGNFKLRATLADSNNQPFLFAQQGMVLNVGANSVEIPFNGDDIAAHGVSGPFTLSDLVVTPLDPDFGNQQFRLTNGFTTAPLNVADFTQRVQLTVTTNLASADGYVQVTPVSADGSYAQGTQLQLHPVFSSTPPSSWSWSVDNGSEITTPILSLTMDTSHQVRLTIQQGSTPTSTSTATTTPTGTPTQTPTSTATATPTPTSTTENRKVFLPLVLR